MSDIMKLEVLAEDNATSVLKGVQKSVDDTTKTIKSSWDKITARWERNKQTFTNMRNYWIVAFGAISAFAIKSIADYADAQKSSIMLEHAVLKVTKATKEQLKATSDLADTLEKKWVLDWDNIKMWLAQLSTFWLSNKAVQALWWSLADLSVNQFWVSASWEQMADSANMIAKALNWQFWILEKSGIRFTDAQQKMIEFWSEMEKVKAINEGFAQNLKYTNEVALQGFDWQMAKVRVQMGNLSESLWQSLTPILTSLMQTITPIIQKFIDWTAANPEMTKNIFLMAGWLAWLVTVLWMVWLAIGPIVAWVTALLSPIWLVIAWVALLATAWATNFLWIRDATMPIVEEIWQWIQIAWTGIKEVVMSVVTALKSAWNEFLSALWITNSEFFSWFLTVLQVTFEAIKIYLWISFEIIKWLFTTAWNFIKTYVWGVFGWIKDIIVGGTKMITAFINGEGTTAIRAWFKQMFWWIIKIVLAPVNAVIAVIEWLINTTIGWINKMIGYANKIPGFNVWTIWNVSIPRLEMPAFANGGMVTSPTMAMIWEGGMNEAVVPLPDGRRIPVDMRWQQGVTINIGNLYGTDRETALNFANEMVGQFRRQFMIEAF